MVAYKDGQRVRLVSRNGIDHARRLEDPKVSDLPSRRGSARDQPAYSPGWPRRSAASAADINSKLSPPSSGGDAIPTLSVISWPFGYLEATVSLTIWTNRSAPSRGVETRRAANHYRRAELSRCLLEEPEIIRAKVSKVAS